MVACPSCGVESPDGFRFCPGCGSPLSTQATPTAAPEERKVVTALFCDLVGFTATSEGADPEDVDWMLTAYFAMARSQIEAHGGVVEKFIGDAVLGVFGVPAAHEDDPERAVRAALRIVDEAERLPGLAGAPLRLRVGINTGEALVRLGVVPGSGERFLAGDAINTASRIQSVAPEMGVAVGPGTYEATKGLFDYEELPPATLKGKVEPVRVFHARSPLARLGVDLTRASDSPYVGREIDLGLLKGLFDKSVAASSVQLVTVVGEPGIGKSRIVAELLAHAQAKAPALTWRQGRCLPYGDGVTFWALGEIVKAQAGILETDDPEVATHKIDGVVPAGPDRDWLRQRLLPLVGVDASSGAEREELFAAWRTFLEAVAEQTPTVLVFEDIHWADDAMLAFLEHLADRAEGVPLLLVATARPELFERQATFAAGLPNVNRINLARLSDEETGRLVAGRLGAAVPPGLQAPILERAEGNPLYAEEFVRLLRDRDLLVETDGTVSLRPGAEVPLPDSIGALIAARLDTLTADRKAMLADAAVVGKVFWAGAVAAMGHRDVAEVSEAMHELVRKELVRSARHSSMAGETEYAFWHVLVRDVAYGQLPRASRAARHVSAATWLEAKAGERAEDIAEVLAHHYATALELTRAAGQNEQAAELEGPALRFLALAGEKALNLDLTTAVASFERALALTPPGHERRPELLASFADAAGDVGRLTDAVAAAKEAIALFRARGDLAAAVDAMGVLGGCYFYLADPRQWALSTERLALAGSLPPGPAVARALTGAARVASFSGQEETAVRLSDRAIVLSEEIGEPSFRALMPRGQARCNLGDAGGLDDIREAVEQATQAGQFAFAALCQNNLSALLLPFEGPTSSLAVARAGMGVARARGLVGLVDTFAATTALMLLASGAFDDALEIVEGLEADLTTDANWLVLAEVRSYRAWILTARGKADAVVGSLDWIVTTVRGAQVPEYMVFGLGAPGETRASLGQEATAAALLTEIAEEPRTRRQVTYPALLPSLVRTAVTIGDEALGKLLCDGVDRRFAYADLALTAAQGVFEEAHGELATASATYGDAAERWERFGVVPEQGFALLGRGRCLVGHGRPTEAAPVLQRARGIFERLGAAPALAETDTLLDLAGVSH